MSRRSAARRIPDAVPAIGPAVFGGTGTRADRPGGGQAGGGGPLCAMVRILRRRRAGGGEAECNRPPKVGRCRWIVYRSVARPWDFHVGRNTSFTAQTNRLAQLLSGPGRPDDHLPSGGRHLLHRFAKRYTIYASPFVSYSPNYSMRLFLAPLPVKSRRRWLHGCPAPRRA